MNGLRDGRSAAFLAVFVAVPEPFLVGLVSVSGATVSTSATSPAEPALSRSSLTACLSSGVCRGHLPVSTLVEYSVEQGRQDLNLQPAVLETAALPVELRPFKDDTAGRATRPGLTQTARSPFGRSETDGQRAGLGK